jgi:hypothetical protein
MRDQGIQAPSCSMSTTVPHVSDSDRTLEPTSSPPSLRIMHYAHTATRITSAKIGVTAQKPVRKEKAVDRQLENVPPGLSAAEVEILDHCVACGAPWTIKRTASQKLLHISKCAKRRDLSLQTVRVLISKVNGATGAKSDSHEQEANSTKSLMEHLIGETKPASKRRRVDLATPSVLETEQAQTVLRNKIQTVLAKDEGSDGYSAPPPATQAFATSKLAQRFGTTKSITTQARQIANEESSASSINKATDKDVEHNTSKDVRYQT